MNKEKALTICNSMMFIGLVIYALSATTSISGISVGVILAFLGWIIRIFLTQRFEIKGITPNLPIFVFLVVIILSAIASSQPFMQSLDEVRAIGERVLLYYLVVNGIKDEKQVKWLLICLIGAMCLVAGYESIQVLLYPQKHGDLIAKKHLGGCLGMIIPLVAALIFAPSSWKTRSSLFISLIIMIFCLNLTTNRGAWLGNICAIIFLGLLLSRKILLGTVIVLILTICVLPKQQIEKVHYRVANMFNLKYGPNSSRIYLWKAALSMTKERPLLGYGPDSFQFLYPKYMPNKFPTGVAKEELIFPVHHHAHNVFLHLSAESGILALLSIVWLFISMFKNGWQIYRQTSARWNKILLLGLLACLIDCIIHGMVDYTLMGQTGYLLWFYLGIIIWIGKHRISVEDCNQVSCS